ncbi:MAG TPA: MGMT family protein, partial [Nitrospirota bacterium]|nr:MGMT family protein [Nitrospirota bacterium]
KKIGNPRAVRAVGQALGANPVPIIIPCHRVIGSSGKLCGFAGGLTMKRKLLELEAGKVGRRA